ncbi:hypothetical protein [Anaerosporobacter faecicola]|uniref:hypothetical protein n=1 Tax=Anaerosporobacter faecicola TaxID=2718714 RepID=UPI00143CA18E|nr:hypothetical protein [Anaerosporobacter faecicola]
MSYVAPKVQHQFETLSIDLKNEILKRDVEIYDLTDLIRVLNEITEEAEKVPMQKG